MAEMAESGSGKRLFIRQSSGLVRDVSVTNAKFRLIANAVNALAEGHAPAGPEA